MALLVLTYLINGLIGWPVWCRNFSWFENHATSCVSDAVKIGFEECQWKTGRHSLYYMVCLLSFKVRLFQHYSLICQSTIKLDKEPSIRHQHSLERVFAITDVCRLKGGRGLTDESNLVLIMPVIDEGILTSIYIKNMASCSQKTWKLVYL